MNDIQEFTNKQGKKIGRFNFVDKTFRKKVQHSRHLFRMRDAWGIDKEVVETLKELGCEFIRIKDDESGRIYWSTYADFYKNAIVDVYGMEGMQFFVSRQHFNIIEP